jgi:hypothetical protein
MLYYYGRREYVGTIIQEGRTFFSLGWNNSSSFKKKKCCALKKCSTKKSSTCIQVRSCFEDFIVKNTMVKSNFDLDI